MGLFAKVVVKLASEIVSRHKRLVASLIAVDVNDWRRVECSTTQQVAEKTDRCRLSAIAHTVGSPWRSGRDTGPGSYWERSELETGTAGQPLVLLGVRGPQRSKILAIIVRDHFALK